MAPFTATVAEVVAAIKTAEVTNGATFPGGLVTAIVTVPPRDAAAVEAAATAAGFTADWYQFPGDTFVQVTVGSER